MTLHIITPDIGVFGDCKTKARLRRSPMGLHTRTRLSTLLRLNLDSSLKTAWLYSAAVQFLRVCRHSKRSCRWLGSTRNGHRDPKCPSSRHLRMVGKDTGVPYEGAICAWLLADEAVVCTHSCLTMSWSSR
ncbi:uncharacterized protein TNCV_2609351 [Trichonephila clavipes]|nr:uncharacterized protein TNCV_2609351 [Trichonephila clavipes]